MAVSNSCEHSSDDFLSRIFCLTDGKQKMRDRKSALTLDAAGWPSTFAPVEEHCLRPPAVRIDDSNLQRLSFTARLATLAVGRKTS